MKRTHIILIVAFFVLLAAAFLLNGNQGGQAATAEPQATPDQPHFVLGLVRVNEVYFVPEGTRVSAWCGGVKVAEELTIEYAGEVWYGLDVPAEDPDIDGKDGCVSGEAISFKIAGYDADQPLAWAAGGYTELDLNAPYDRPAPHVVTGDVQVNGAFIPEGIPISAWCGGVKFAENNTDSQSQYSLIVPSDDLITVEKEGCSDGETIAFQIGTLDAEETLTWHGGHTSTLDLSAASQPPGTYQVYGQVRVNDEFVYQGTRISAWCAGLKVVETGTDSNAYYTLVIPGDDPFTPQIEGCGSGEMINFMIGNLEAAPPAIWVAGVSDVPHNLSAEGQIGFDVYLPLILK